MPTGPKALVVLNELEVVALTMHSRSVAELKRSARLVAEFNAAIGDEHYRVYAVE